MMEGHGKVLNYEQSEPFHQQGEGPAMTQGNNPHTQFLIDHYLFILWYCCVV